MPIFNTPEPISATIELASGDVRITASQRDDTVVDVRPSDESHEPDRLAAEQARVEYAAGRLLVKTPRQRGLGLFGKPGSVEVTIGLPAGSQVRGQTAVGTFSCVGQLGECRVKIEAGQIQVDHASEIELSTGFGPITVGRVDGSAEVSTGSGKVRVGEVGGSAVIKNSNGDTWVGQIAGGLRVRAANGDICVEHAQAGVTASTACGDVRVGAAVSGAASLKTACGEIEVGIPPGTAALLDVHTSFGRVLNRLDAADQPEASDDRIDLRARTSAGDILIRRCDKPEMVLKEG
jgi:DUF4097 and DUF4098 domain-containing protein YvlB